MSCEKPSFYEKVVTAMIDIDGQCLCGKPSRPHWGNGLYCGAEQCDECFEQMRRECQERSW